MEFLRSLCCKPVWGEFKNCCKTNYIEFKFNKIAKENVLRLTRNYWNGGWQTGSE